MSAYSSVLGVVVLLLHLWTTHSLPVFQDCPVPCLCQQGPLLNCSSLGLTKTSKHIPPTAVSLNISHNALRSLAPLSDGHVKLKGLLHLWVGSNFLESIDLVLEKSESGTRTLSSEEQECMSWAPDLQLLSADRNRLKHLPGGLHCLKSLQILQLSYNQISEIGPTDLSNSTSLKELHLQQNHIRNIHSRAFIYLKQLQVLDLSYNHLATVPVPAYQSLQNLNALVNISFNRWKCDCNLQTLRRWISFDVEVGDASWQVVCDSPSHHAGKDLLHLKDSDLTCPTHKHSTSGHYRNIMVDEGTQISISCNNDGQDFMQVHWWTPHGQVTNNQTELLMKDITEQHEGLYICAYGLKLEHISIFDLQVYTKASDPRPRREAPIPDERVEQENTNAHRNSLVQATKSQSEFVLAVCLSVFITFIVAFILGVLLRPLLDKLWRRIRSKRNSSPSPPTSRASSTGPQLYVNEGFSDAGDHEQVVRVGSRVTFGGITEVGDQGRNMPYYVTVEDVHSDGSSESNTEVVIVNEDTQKRMTVEKDDHRGRANSISSSSSSTMQEGKVNVLGMKDKVLAPSSTTDLELEQIPDAHDITQPKRKSSTSSSSSSSSSHSRQTLDRNISSEVRESTEQSVDPPAVIIPVHKTTTKDEIPGFTKEPFTGWPTGLTEQNVDFDAEFLNDSGESFSFNEESEKSSVRDLSSSALGYPVSDDTWRQGNIESPTNKLNFTSHVLIGKEVSVDDVNQLKRSDTLSSSSSSESSDFEGPNSYTVNPELEEKSEIFKESYRKIESDKLWTPEDDHFNKSQPAAGILIRQETITLDSSDIHLRFTHEESVDEDMFMDESQRISEGIFGICTDVSLDTVPKVKRYVQFTQSKPSISPSSKKNNVTPVKEKSEAEVDTTPGEDSHLTQTKVSFEGISKVKRYINFKQSDTHSPTLPSSPSSTNKYLSVEARRHSTSSEDEAELTSDEEKFFRKTGVSPACIPKVKRYIQFNQIPPASPTLSVFRPSTKIESTTKKYISPPIDQRKQLSSSNFSPEGLPLYHVHPSYKTNQSRLNKDSEIDKSSSESSSEDENKHTAYPRKLEIKTEPEINKGYMTQEKNTENVLNIDFDNSSSSTDVFEKKPIKGLARLKMLSTLLFSRHNNETEVQTGTTTPDQSYKMHLKLTEDMEQTTTNEDNFLGHIESPEIGLPLVNRENTHEEKAEFESKRSSLSSSSDEGRISPKHEEDITLEKSLSLDQLPKVKQYIQFSHTDPHSQAWLPSPPPTTRVVIPELTATNESRRSSSSSEDDVKQSTEGQNFYGFSKVKRYIKFTHTEPYSPTQQTNKQSISTSIVAPPDSRRSSSSSEDDIKAVVETISSTPIMLNVRSDPNEIEVKSEANVDTSPREAKEQGKLFIERIPKVKRYIHFKQSEPYSPILPILSTSPTKDVRVEAKRYSTSEDEAELTTVATTGAVMKSLQCSSSSEDESSPTKEKNEFFEETGVSFDRIPQVKKYLQFKQPLPHLQVAPPTTTLNTLHVTPESKTKQESRRLSSSSEDDDTTTAQLFAQTRTDSLDRIPKVKRYIHFTQSESQSSAPSTTSQMISKSVVVHETRKASSSSEEDVKLSSNDEEQVTGESFVKIQKVNRYIQFTQSEDFMGLSPFPLKSTKENETEVRGANTLDKDDAQPANRENKIESRRMSTSSSSEDDYTTTTKKYNFKGQIGTTLDRIPKVKRYIHFTHPERHSPPLPTTAQKVKISSVIQKTRRLSTSSEEDVKPSTKDNNSVYKQMDASFSQLPKVQKYIEFKQHETSLPFNSSTMEDTKLNKLSVTSVKTYSTYKTKAGIETESSSSSSDESLPSSIVVKTESELVKSELFQIGLKPELPKSNYLSRDHRNLVGHVVKDASPPQNDPPAVPQTPPPLLEQDYAREYLRDNSQVRQRQERRRILQQRRKGMDDYSFTSLSSISQEGNKQDSGSLMDYREAMLMHSDHAHGSAFTANNVTSRHTEVAEGQTLQGLKTKKTSALRSKSPTDSANTKYKEFLI